MRRVGLVMAVAVAMVLGGSALPSAASAPFVKATYAWGHNVCGMGLYEFPFNYAQATPVAMAGLVNDVTQVSAGWGFNVVLRADGTVWAWGFNDSGQLGMGSSESYSVFCDPVPVIGLPPGIVQVSAGFTHSLAVASDGSVWAWGSNHYGQLGAFGQLSPVAVRVPGLTGVRQVAAGADFSVALRTNGEVWTWGRGDHGQLGDGTHVMSRRTPARATVGYGVIQIAAGYSHALALRPGSLWAWGANHAGQLGNGTTVADSAIAVRVDRSTDRVTQIAAGTSHSLALDADGSIWAWGSNREGQLGNGVDDEWNAPGHNIPIHLATPAVTQVSASVGTSLAVLADGGLLMWGGTLVVADGVVMPHVVGEIEATAVWRLQDAGLVVHIERPYDRRECERVGVVVGQGPSAGRILRPATTVVIEVPRQPPVGCY